MTKPPKDPREPGIASPSRGKRRIRRPSLRDVLTQARRAGVVIGLVQVAPDGSITIVPSVEEKSAPAESDDTASDWDVI
jgi:hypothetical protein